MQNSENILVLRYQPMTEETKKILGKDLLKRLIILLFAGLFLILPGGLSYWQAWLFLLNAGICWVCLLIFTACFRPTLLKLRTEGIHPGQQERQVQKSIMALGILVAVASVLVPALEHRFGWSPQMPMVFVIMGNVLIVLATLGFGAVYAVNPWCGTKIRQEYGHRLVRVGPYAFVQHPHYFFSVMVFAGLPLALGSWWGVVVFFFYIPVPTARIKDETVFLLGIFPEYAGYRKETRSILIPGDYLIFELLQWFRKALGR